MANKKNRDTGYSIRLRYVFAASLIVLLSAFIVLSVLKTTVWDADKWRAKAEEDLSRTEIIMPVRGDILAADGSVLATNLRYYTVRMDFRANNFKKKEFVESLDSLCDSLAKYHPQRDAQGWKDLFNAQLTLPHDSLRSHCYTILRNITHDQWEQLRTFPFFHRWNRNPNKTGLTYEVINRRSYPFGDMARRSIGRVGYLEESKQTRGISGLERALDDKLFGIPGRYKRIPLTHGISNWTDIPPVHGATLRTTIDITMQDIVENELNAMLEQTHAQWGTAILMDVKTGDIRAISNLERDSVTGKYIEAMNRALQAFEPGSVMKTISMVVALEDGFVTNLDQSYVIGGGYVFGGGGAIRDTHSPHELPVRRFLEYSSNIGMTKLVAPHYAADPDSFRRRLVRMGLFDALGTGISGETPPLFPRLPKGREGQVSLGRQTYGYATMIPPLYMCAFYNAVANDGKFVRPRIVKGIITEQGEEEIPVSYVRPTICTPQHALQVRQMLREVIYGKGGTAKRLKNDLVTIAGKTGTAKIALEVPREERERSARAMKLARTHADSVAARPRAPRGYREGHYRYAFCGFFPYEKPQYTCMVLISDPVAGYGAASTSGEVLKNIALKMYSRGMLNNTANYTDDTRATMGAHPTVYAATTAQRDSALQAVLGTANVHRVRPPASTAAGTVPDVTGLSARDAVAVIEQAGFNVTVHGVGYVTDQLPVPGARPGRGARIHLVLKH